MENNKYRKPIKFKTQKDPAFLLFLLLIFISECIFVLVIPYFYIGEIPNLSISFIYFLLVPCFFIFMWVWASSAYYLFEDVLVFQIGPFYRKTKVREIWQIKSGKYPLMGFGVNSPGTTKVLQINAEGSIRIYLAPKDPMLLHEALKEINPEIVFEK